MSTNAKGLYEKDFAAIWLADRSRRLRNKVRRKDKVLWIVLTRLAEEIRVEEEQG